MAKIKHIDIAKRIREIRVRKKSRWKMFTSPPALTLHELNVANAIRQ